jgi:hypothetical protein
MLGSHFVVLDPLVYSPLSASPYLNSRFCSVRAPRFPSALHRPPLFHQVTRVLRGDGEWDELLSFSQFGSGVRQSAARIVRVLGPWSSDCLLELVSSAGSRPSGDPSLAITGNEDVHEKALLDEGVSPKVISLMREWIDQRIENRWWGGAFAGEPGWQRSEASSGESHGHSSTDLATRARCSATRSRVRIWMVMAWLLNYRCAPGSASHGCERVVL